MGVRARALLCFQPVSGALARLPRTVASVASLAGICLLGIAVIAYDKLTPFPGFAALLPCLGAALIIAAGEGGPSIGGRILSLRPLVWIGLISYSLYLWHWPILLLAPTLLGHLLGLGERLTAAAVSGVLAVLTLCLIENPIRFAAPLRRSALRSLAVGALATAAAVCVSIALLIAIPAPIGRGLATQTLAITEGPPQVGATIDQYNAVVQHDFAQVQAAVAASADLDDVPANLDPSLAKAPGEDERLSFNGCMRESLEVGQPECAMGDTASPTTVALIGDSNAAMWTPGFQQAAAHRHWRLELLAKAACPMLDLFTWNPVAEREYTECDQWRAEIIARLQSEHPKLIVYSVSRAYHYSTVTSYNAAWLDSMTRFVQRLRGTGAQVLVLGKIPAPQSEVPTCLSVHLDHATACSPLRSVAVNDPGIAAETTAVKAGGGQYADLTKLFCTAERCPAIVGDTLVYFDESHVTFEYCRLLAPVLGALADRALIQR